MSSSTILSILKEDSSNFSEWTQRPIARGVVDPPVWNTPEECINFAHKYMLKYVIEGDKLYLGKPITLQQAKEFYNSIALEAKNEDEDPLVYFNRIYHADTHFEMSNNIIISPKNTEGIYFPWMNWQPSINDICKFTIDSMNLLSIYGPPFDCKINLIDTHVIDLNIQDWVDLQFVSNCTISFIISKNPKATLVMTEENNKDLGAKSRYMIKVYEPCPKYPDTKVGICGTISL